MIEIAENDVIIIISTTLLEGGRGLDCFQIVYYALTISLNIFCEGLQVIVAIFTTEACDNLKKYINLLSSIWLAILLEIFQPATLSP